MNPRAVLAEVVGAVMAAVILIFFGTALGLKYLFDLLHPRSRKRK